MSDLQAPGQSLEVQAVRTEIRRLMADFGPDYWAEQDRERQFPERFFTVMGEAGYFGTLIPTTHGGTDVGVAIASVIVEEINRAGGDAAAVNAQMSICETLVRDGSPTLKERYLESIAEGRLRLLTVAATEPDSGADMSTLRSTAQRDSDGWIVAAHKVFISLADHTRLMFLLVNTDQGPTLFLLDRDAYPDGITTSPMSMITNRLTTTLFVDEIWVPDSARVGDVGSGLESLMKGFAARRILAAAEAIGHARFMLDQSINHAKTRMTVDRPIGQHQGVQYPLTQAYAHVEAANLMRWEALRVLDSGEDAGGKSAMAKVLASEASWQTARAALTAFGGWGLASELHIERKLRESTVYVFNNLLWNYIAQHVLGLPQAI